MGENDPWLCNCWVLHEHGISIMDLNISMLPIDIEHSGLGKNRLIIITKIGLQSLHICTLHVTTLGPKDSKPQDSISLKFFLAPLESTLLQNPLMKEVCDHILLFLFLLLLLL